VFPKRGISKRERKKKVHERNIHLGEFVSYAILTLALPQTAALMGQNIMMYYVGMISEDSLHGPSRLLDDALLRRTSLIVLPMSVSFWLRSLFPHPLLWKGSSVDRQLCSSELTA
jgi:hypothetical protein